MAAIRSSNRAFRAAVDAVLTDRYTGARVSARAPINRLPAVLNMTTTGPFRHCGGESIEAGPRDGDTIRERMAVAECARTQLWQWIHPVTGTPCAGRAVHVDPVPEALHVEPSGAAYVHGRRSVVCVRVDELVRNRDCADFPTTKA